MAENERLVCRSDELQDGGAGVRFELMHGGKKSPAFVVRYLGAPRAYLNRCAHLPNELDDTPGRFFDASGTLLVCALHGATYHADTGKCYLGPCSRGGLIRLFVWERSGRVFVAESGQV
jgi:nitrite reductase/ring-hydroxylating ferredoxin subunit